MKLNFNYPQESPPHTPINTGKDLTCLDVLPSGVGPAERDWCSWKRPPLPLPEEGMLGPELFSTGVFWLLFRLAACSPVADVDRLGAACRCRLELAEDETEEAEGRGALKLAEEGAEDWGALKLAEEGAMGRGPLKLAEEGAEDTGALKLEVSWLGWKRPPLPPAHIGLGCTLELSHEDKFPWAFICL